MWAELKILVEQAFGYSNFQKIMEDSKIIFIKNFQLWLQNNNLNNITIYVYGLLSYIYIYIYIAMYILY